VKSRAKKSCRNLESTAGSRITHLKPHTTMSSHLQSARAANRRARAREQDEASSEDEVAETQASQSKRRKGKGRARDSDLDLDDDDDAVPTQTQGRKATQTQGAGATQGLTVDSIGSAVCSRLYQLAERMRFKEDV
jgi:hypothetical protein